LSLIAELMCPAATVSLLRQMRSLQACFEDGDGGSNVVFGEAVARRFCLLYFGSGTCVVVSGGRGRRFPFPCFCERDGIPDGFCCCATDDVGDGGWLFRVPVVWPPAAVFSSSPTLHKLAVDGLSSLVSVG
jgi:hypothetical protein